MTLQTAEPTLEPTARRAMTVNLAIAVVVIGFVLSQLAGSLTRQVLQVLSAAAGGSIHTAGHVLLVMAASSLTLCCVALAAAAGTGAGVGKVLGLRRASLPVVGAACVGTVLVGPLADAIVQAMQARFPSWGLGVLPMLDEVVRTRAAWQLWPVFALLPGLSEELLFRGVLQRAIEPRQSAFIWSGVAFALFHVDPHHVAGVLPLGLYLAWLGARAGTWVTIAAHVANNSLAIVLMKYVEPETSSSSRAPWPPEVLALSLFGALICAWLVARWTARPVSQSE